MTEIKLLILDDDTKVTDSYTETIKRINRDTENPLNYKVYVANTLDKAKEYIKYNKLDTAIIDLNLCVDKSDLLNADGNKAIEEIKIFFRMPIFVVSGELDKLEEKFKNNNLIIPKTRDDSVSEIFVIDIPSVYNSKSMQYFSRNGHLEQKINEFYWNHLEKTWKSWSEVNEVHSTKIDTILSRHTVSCLNEQLYVNGNIGSFDKYHPGEMYIIPPIKEHYHTGDIIENSDSLFVIINPACDIVNKNKLHMYTIVKIIKAVDIESIKNKTLAKRREYIESTLKKTNNLDRYHFLPKFNKITDDYVIDFQDISTIDIGENTNSGNINYFKDREEKIKKYKRIASISSPFLKDVIARFSAYYARQGQPNLFF